MLDSAGAIAIIAGAFVLAGTVKGVIGMGLPTVAMGLLGLVMPPVQAAALLVVPSLATNIWQMLASPGLAAAVRRFATMLLGVCAGIFLGIGLLTGGPGPLASVVGQKIRRSVHPDAFRRWFFAGLLVLGTYMLVRAVMA